MNAQKSPFEWQRLPNAEAYLARLLDQCEDALPELRSLKHRLETEADLRLFDCLDHFLVQEGKETLETLEGLGFELMHAPADEGCVALGHPGAALPAVVLRREGTGKERALGLAIKVERVDRFLVAQGVHAPIEGAPLSPFRRAAVLKRKEASIWAVERRGTTGFLPVETVGAHPGAVLEGLESWFTRPRRFESAREGMARTLERAEHLAASLGRDLAAWTAFRAERDYWLLRNRAGAVQRRRQERLGLGLANHDHYTFRSSRKHFAGLLKILAALGFKPREKFFAGKEAGWGAQVLEQPVAGIMVFADVDLAPEEISGDLGSSTLSERASLGTVGLWCALHGESMLQAGLHHLAVRVHFEASDRGLHTEGVESLAPFSTFPYLKQAFTTGERWPVAPERLAALESVGRITNDQRRRFEAEGAVGSHMERIERNEGFKGFNQTSVSDIIQRTDPRLEAESGTA
jgi:hypothetical protein